MTNPTVLRRICFALNLYTRRRSRATLYRQSQHHQFSDELHLISFKVVSIMYFSIMHLNKAPNTEYWQLSDFKPQPPLTYWKKALLYLL